jgi:hypothetical protein
VLGVVSLKHNNIINLCSVAAPFVRSTIAPSMHELIPPPSRNENGNAALTLILSAAVRSHFFFKWTRWLWRKVRSADFDTPP